MHKLPSLYAITDPALLPGERLFTAVAQALEGGCKWIQYRNKAHISIAERLAQAQRLNRLCLAQGGVLIINDDVELAQAVGAAGVHLGREDGSISSARERLGASAIIGATCHDSLLFAQESMAAGADYVAFGRFFASTTKPQAQAAPLDLISQAVTLALPLVVIGGINVHTLPILKQAGARCFALCEAVFGGEDVVARCRELLQLAECTAEG
ncbi:MAG: thiamine phosphate synthase [Sphingobacteriales bacterium]|nr:MAG: thiamine phosphate synthase [Sphingobacteriales bacterium]